MFSTLTIVATVIVLAGTTIVGGGQPLFDLSGVAAMITALTGVGLFVGSMIKGRQNNKRVEEVEQAASYIQGFDALVKRLQEEVDTLRQEGSEDRKKWIEERTQLMETIRTLRGELQESMTQHSLTRSQLEMLRGQIKGFLNDKDYAEFQKHL